MICHKCHNLVDRNWDIAKSGTPIEGMRALIHIGAHAEAMEADHEAEMIRYAPHYTIVWDHNSNDYYAGSPAVIYKDSTPIWEGSSYDRAAEILKAIVGEEYVTEKDKL